MPSVMWSVGPLTAITDCCWFARSLATATAASGESTDSTPRPPSPPAIASISEALPRMMAGRPSRQRLGDTGDGEVHGAGGVVIWSAEVDQQAPRDGSELARLAGVVDH